MKKFSKQTNRVSLFALFAVRSYYRLNFTALTNFPQKTFAPFLDLSVSGRKIARIPRIGNIPRPFRKIQQSMYFSVRITRTAHYALYVPRFHGKYIIVFRIIGRFVLYRPLADAFDAVFSQLHTRGRIYGIAFFFRACPRRSYKKTIRKPFTLQQILKNKFPHGRTAYIAKTHKQYAFHRDPFSNDSLTFVFEKDERLQPFVLSVVEVTGLEPTTSWSRTKRATKLRYTSMFSVLFGRHATLCTAAATDICSVGYTFENPLPFPDSLYIITEAHAFVKR